VKLLRNSVFRCKNKGLKKSDESIQNENHWEDEDYIKLVIKLRKQATIEFKEKIYLCELLTYGEIFLSK
jgi:hypothetical protein